MPGLDYLHSTTYDPQLEQQDDVINMLSSQAAAQDTNNPADMQEVSDEDLSNLVEQEDAPEQENEEISDSDADKMATDTHDFENEELDPIDYQLMGYLMGDSGTQAPTASMKPSMQYGGGTLVGAGTVYGTNNGLDEAAIKRLNNIKFASLNRNSSKYQPQAPNSPVNRDTYNYNELHAKAMQFINNDPVAKQMGLSIEQLGGATHDVRYKAGGGAYHVGYQNGGKVSPEYNGGQYAVGGRYTFPGMKMPRPTTTVRQLGGGTTLVADTPQTQRVGLNNENYKRAVLNLKGVNTIRGLDSGKPVGVTDGSKYAVLHGPKDTAQFNGKVYENRL